MLYQASAGDIISSRISRDDGYVAVVMRHYPRYMRRELRDEYIYALSPPRLLFEAFRRVKESTLDHEFAFRSVNYESEFWLEEEGFLALKRLARKAEKHPVYLVCQCTVGEVCHRELLLLAAREFFGAPIGKIHGRYPEFRKRLKAKRREIASQIGTVSDRKEVTRSRGEEIGR